MALWVFFVGRDCGRFVGKVRCISSLDWSGCMSLGMSHGRKYQHDNHEADGGGECSASSERGRRQCYAELLPLFRYYGSFSCIAEIPPLIYK